MIDRMTDIQRNVSIVEGQAEAIRKTAQTMHELIDSISPDGGYKGIRAALEAKCEGIESWAYQIWAESALIRSADDYQQERLAEARAAVDPTSSAAFSPRATIAGDPREPDEGSDEWQDEHLAVVDGDLVYNLESGALIGRLATILHGDPID